MDNKIKLIGIGNIPFLESKIEENKDYALTLICSLYSVEDLAKHGEETAPKYYKLKVDRIAQVMPIGDKKPLTIRPGKTKSQILRWKLEELARMMGKNEDDLYEEIMNKNIEKVELKIDELRR